MAGVHVRSATPADAAALARIFRRAALSNENDRVALLAHPESLRLDDNVIAGGRTLVATLADGTVAGFASTRTTDPDVAELDDLFVDPDVRRRGVARELLRRIVTQLRTDGVARLEVTANPHALDFYRAVGFADAGTTRTPFGPAPRMHLDVATGDIAAR